MGDNMDTKVKKKMNMWLKILIVLLVYFLVVVTVSYCVMRFSCKSIADRGIFLQYSKQTVLNLEPAELEQVNIDEYNLKRVEVFKSNETVNYYGYDATVCYVFWQDKLYLTYFFIENDSAQQLEATKNDIKEKLSQDYDISAKYNYHWQVKDENVELGERKVALKELKTLGVREQIVEVSSDCRTYVGIGYNYFPVNKDLWAKLANKEYESLVGENTLVVEYGLEFSFALKTIWVEDSFE